jgi:uncharacterized protein YeaO (DUF488 family)
MTGHIPASHIHVKRIYEEPSSDDGQRLLVDRLWPRGVAKAKAALSEWIKDIAPSDELRAWFNHEPERWDEFRRRYAVELRGRSELVARIRDMAREAPITLLYGAHDEAHNNAVALREFLLGR